MSKTLLIFLQLCGAMSLLIYGMKVMSEALQKLTGPKLRGALAGMTANRFLGVVSGAGVTMAVQSSTATTVMTVSFVNAGLLTLAQAISVIMGANIGTTLTAWIMSAGFSFKISDLVWPMFFVGIILIFWKRGKYTGEFLYGLAFMLFSLAILKQAGTEMDLANNADIVNFFASFDVDSFLTIIIFLLVGSALTFLVHSSAAVMAITMILCSSGVLPIYLGIALVLGENIGTTLTANIAALAGNAQARRAALAHLLFNVFGVVWVLCVFRFFVDMACGFVGLDPHAAEQDPVKVSFALASFHTTFNLVNTFILIWFVPQFERVIRAMIKDKAERTPEEDVKLRLQFITGGILKTPELSITQANRELNQFSARILEMVRLVTSLTLERDPAKANEIAEQLHKYEAFCDEAEDAIGKYLSNILASDLSEESTSIVRQLIAQLACIESIGDCCYSLSRLLQSYHIGKERFSEAQRAAVARANAFCLEGLEAMIAATVEEADRSVDVSRIRAVRIGMRSLFDECHALNISEIEKGHCTYAACSNFKDCVNLLNSVCYYAFHTVELQVHAKIPTKGVAAATPETNTVTA